VLESHTDYRINYMQYKGIWPVDNREFINVSAKEVNPDNTYIATVAYFFLLLIEEIYV
jgi:hypothetical protein